MFWKRWRMSRLRALLVGAALLLLLAAAAKIHACACTGGPPRWQPAFPTSAP
jgi:hypothetical protein